jgi:hypothetical protein
VLHVRGRDLQAFADPLAHGDTFEANGHRITESLDRTVLGVLAGFRPGRWRSEQRTAPPLLLSQPDERLNSTKQLDSR